MSLTLQWESQEMTGDKVAQIMIYDLVQAAKINWNDYAYLQNVRQTCLVVALALEKRMGEIRHPESMGRDPEPALDRTDTKPRKDFVCANCDKLAPFYLNGLFLCEQCRDSEVHI